MMSLCPRTYGRFPSHPFDVQIENSSDSGPPNSELLQTGGRTNFDSVTRLSKKQQSDTGNTASVTKKAAEGNYCQLLQKHGTGRMQMGLSRTLSTNKHPEVFLGGSCNPTTWRLDDAIPILQKHSVTFFNPQVPDWSPGMIEVESKAKEHSNILLFVIDDRTRNVVSLMEVANFLAGERKNLVVVINTFIAPGKVISSEEITSEESDDLSASLHLLNQLIERHKVPIFSNVHDAIYYTIELNKQINDNKKRVTKIKEIIDLLDIEKYGHIDLKNIQKLLALKSQNGNTLIEDTVKQIEKYYKMNKKTKRINFEQFHQIVLDCDLNSDRKKSDNHVITRIKFSRSSSTSYRKPKFSSNENLHLTDIYLGGDCAPYINWRQKFAIPVFEDVFLTCYNPENERAINQKISPTEFAVINNSKVLLFIISNDSLSLFTMIMAAYYLGANANMVLCIQKLPEKSVIGSHKLSATALKDYNRGRMYLADMAQRQKVPVFESIQDAVQAAMDKCMK